MDVKVNSIIIMHLQWKTDQPIANFLTLLNQFFQPKTSQYFSEFY